MNDELKSIDAVKQAITAMALQFGPKVLVALAILVAGVFVARGASRLTDRSMQRYELDPPLCHLLRRCVWLLVISLFVIIALQNLGVQLLPLVAGLGVAGAGIALAMQGAVGDAIAGLSIIFTKPFRVGDYVAVAGAEGQVQSIVMSRTTLSHPDLSQVVIPNRKIVGEVLHNYGRIRQLEVAVSIARDSDLDLALSTMQAVVRDNPRCMTEPVPPVAVSGFADGGIRITALPWVSVDDYAAAAGEIKKAIIEAYRARSIHAPMAAREVQMTGKLKLARRKPKLNAIDLVRSSELVLKQPELQPLVAPVIAPEAKPPH